jgi:two-component system LytT family response regulator
MMKALIVDDEPLARSALATALTKHPEITGVESACDAIEALDKIRQSHYDLVLLDINMPEITGIQLLDQLAAEEKDLPAIIFVTAHNEHAVAAFEREAVDYVLKPFSQERIMEAVVRACRRTRSERAQHLTAALPHLQEINRSKRLAIKADGRILFLDPADIISVEAEGNYVLLQRQNGSYLLRESITVVAEKLQAYGFIRIHRSVLVNSAFVAEIQPWSTGEYVLKLRSGKEYTVTRTYKQNLSKLATFWIGTDSFSAERP